MGTWLTEMNNFAFGYWDIGVILGDIGVGPSWAIENKLKICKSCPESSRRRILPHHPPDDRTGRPLFDWWPSPQRDIPRLRNNRLFQNSCYDLYHLNNFVIKALIFYRYAIISLSGNFIERIFCGRLRMSAVNPIYNLPCGRVPYLVFHPAAGLLPVYHTCVCPWRGPVWFWPCRLWNRFLTVPG